MTEVFKVGDDALDRMRVGEHWVFVASLYHTVPTQWAEAISEVQDYAMLEAGWRGVDTRAVADGVAVSAKILLRQLAEAIPQGYFPMVGADDEGSIVLTWSEVDVLGNLSIRDKGKYSYFVKRNGTVVKAGTAFVAEPIADDLLKALRAD